LGQDGFGDISAANLTILLVRLKRSLKLQNQLKVESVNKMSSVLALTVTGPLMKKSEDYLDNLVQVYNEGCCR
jgi:hypothetical protein